MKITQLKFGANFWIVFSTILFIGFGYLFYLKFYVAEKENRIISSSFRVLDKIGDNIDTKLRSYPNNAAEYEPGQPYNNSSLELISSYDSVHTEDDLKDNYEDLYTDYYFVPTAGITNTFKFKVSYKKLMIGLSRKDVFDELILIKDTFVIFNSLEQDLKFTSTESLSEIIQSSGEKEDTTKNFTLFATDNNSLDNLIFSGETFDLTISNINYIAFLKPIKANNKQWYIIGLTKKSKYNAARLSIKPWIIILLSILLILIILGLPIIKLKVISKTEQLKTGTIINFAISILLGGTLLTLFAFFIIESFSHKAEIDSKLKGLSDEIFEEFKKEIDSSLSQLANYDTTFKEFDSRPYGLGEDVLNKKDTLPCIYPYADHFFWVKKNGWQAKGLTVYPKIGKASDLINREYFKKRDEWYHTLNEKTIKFRMESIVSVSSGAIKTAVSMPSRNSDDSIQTIALTSRFYSVIDPIIPKNFSFCIIDKTGKVWFHSDKNRNLNEDLIAECNDNKYLKAALYRNFTKAINVEYYNKAHRIYIAPIAKLPLYLVTFYDKQNDNSFQAQTVTLTVILLGLLFLLLTIQIAALLIIEGSFHWSVTKNIIMKLVRPMKHHNEIYKYLIKVNIIIFGIVFLFFVFYLRDIVSMISIFTILIYLFTYMYWVLNENPDKKKAIRGFTIFNFIIVVFINIIGGFLVKWDGFCELLIIQGVIICILIICNRFLKPQYCTLRNNYIDNYTKFVVVLLLIFGVLPSLVFFKLAHNTEIEIRTKHTQMDLMKQREKRNLSIYRYYNEITKGENVNKFLKRRKELGIYTTFFNETEFLVNEKSIPFCADTIPFCADTSDYWDNLVCYFRPFYDKEITENKCLIFNYQKGSAVSWRKKNDLLTMEYTSFTEDTECKTLQTKNIQSTVHKIQSYFPFHTDDCFWSPLALTFNILFWLIVLFILFGFYFVIKFGASKVFCLDIANGYSHQAFFERVNNYLFAGNNLLITRLSYIDETNGFSKQLSSADGFIYLDWSDEDEVTESLQKIETELVKFCKHKKTKKNNVNSNKKLTDSLIVVIDHFDWNYQDEVDLFNRISLIQQFDNWKDIIIVVLAQTSEITILEYYESLIVQCIETKKDVDILTKTKNAFENLLKKMEIIRQPINYTHSYKDEDRYCCPIPYITATNELIEKELSASDYLKQLKPVMIDYYTNHCDFINCDNKAERVLRRITQLADRYYTDLLESCNTEEKYVLYDTADDLIINPKNEASIIRLLKKGLLVKKCDMIDFMNISFRRFVLQSLDKAESEQLEIKMGEESGTWKGYRAMLTIIIAALFLFIGLANQDFLTNLNELFMAVGVGIAGITGILSKLSESKNSSN